MKNIYFLSLAFLLNLSSFAATFSVDSQVTFNTALASANSGDIIEWVSGTYSDIFMDITKSDIIVQAAAIGDVTFNGASRVEIDGNNVTFNGFQYIGGDILIIGSTNTIDQTIITVNGSNVEITNINFSQYTCWKYLRIRDVSQNTTVSYCNFENRLNYADQNIFQIDVNATQSGFHKVQYCSFKNFTGAPGSTGGDDGVEPIRTGSSSQSLYSSKTTIEYCYFTQCNGDDEIISSKATDCIYRYNTLEGNNGEIVLRHGNKAVVYGNFFVNNEAGVRVREGSDHIIYNNYFSGLTDKSIDLQASPDDIDRGVVRVQNVTIAHNTFVGTDNIDLGDDNVTYDPLNTVFINNIFDDTTSSNHFRSPTGNETWIGNIVDDLLDLGLSPVPAGFTETDPLLSLNTDGYYQLDALSPAIDAAADDSPSLFPFPLVTGLPYDNEILLDVISETRPSTIASKDVGAQEYNASAEITPYLSADNTGPLYLMPGYDPLSTDDFIKVLGSDFEIYPNPLPKNQINLSFSTKNRSIIEVLLYDITGKKIQSIMNETLDTGAYNLSKIITDVTSGAYLIKVNVKDTKGNLKASKTEKFIKL